MTDRPLDPTTLEALRGAMTASDSPAVDPQTWHEMLRHTFEATGDDNVHGDLDGADLLPQDWPASTASAADHATGGVQAADDDDWGPFDEGGWSGPDPAGGGFGEGDNADGDGGDLT